jgi:hypothetical protein
MFQPTEAQAQVLAQHGIRTEQVLDARGMTRKRWKAECERQNTVWAFTPDSPCQKGGHVLRDRSGHCVQCDPLENVVYAPLGQFLQYQAWHKNISGVRQGPLPFFWGVTKAA